MYNYDHNIFLDERAKIDICSISAGAIGQASITKDYLHSVKQVMETV